MTSPLPLSNVINTPDFAPRLSDKDNEEEEEEVVPDSLPPDALVADDADDAAEATFLTPRRRPASCQVLVPETPVAEMGLTHVEKVTMARRRFREARLAPTDHDL